MFTYMTSSVQMYKFMYVQAWTVVYVHWSVLYNIEQCIKWDVFKCMCEQWYTIICKWYTICTSVCMNNDIQSYVSDIQHVHVLCVSNIDCCGIVMRGIYDDALLCYTLYDTYILTIHAMIL